MLAIIMFFRILIVVLAVIATRSGVGYRAWLVAAIPFLVGIYADQQIDDVSQAVMQSLLSMEAESRGTAYTMLGDLIRARITGFYVIVIGTQIVTTLVLGYMIRKQTRRTVGENLQPENVNSHGSRASDRNTTRMAQLEVMRKNNAISAEEYAEKRQRILDELDQATMASAKNLTYSKARPYVVSLEALQVLHAKHILTNAEYDNERTKILQRLHSPN